MINKICMIVSCFLLFSCASQAPAPIEFKSLEAKSEKKIVKRDLKINDDSMSAEEVKNSSENYAKEDKPFVTEKKVYEQESKEQSKPIDSQKLEDELSESEYEQEDVISPTQEDKKEIGDVIAPKENPHTVSTNAESLFMMPVNGTIISKFGEIYMGKKNNGINIAASAGDEVKAVSDGAVIYSGDDARFGKLMIIKHNQGDLFSAYAHMSDLEFAQNDIVKKGQVIGHVGQTGDVKKPQLHFAIRKGKTPVDPVAYLAK